VKQIMLFNLSNGYLERLATERKADKGNDVMLSLRSITKDLPAIQKLAVT
jgi:hypothetical protein